MDPQRLEIRNHTFELRRVSVWLNALCQEAGVAPALAFDLEVCAHEAVTNVIEHAYLDEGEHRIELGLCIDDGSVTLRIEDDGSPFNPLEAPPRASPVDLEDAQIGGLGLPLIRSLASECSYRRDADRNSLTLRMLTRQIA